MTLGLVWEKGIGIPGGSWQNKGGLYKVDVKNPKGYNIRLPNSSNSSANELFVPGGKTSGGISEAVIDPVPKNQLDIIKVI